MTTHVTPDVLDEMVQIIIEEVDPEKIVLFGSRSRGDETLHSDVDLLVIVREPFGPERSRRLTTARILKRMIPLPVSKDILLYSAEEAEQGAQDVLRDALDEGRVLYERAEKGSNNS
jgi:uncharacterized protein